MKQSGIIVDTSVVFGYPTETKETIKQTFDQCLKAGLYPSIGFLMPLPYTVMYDYAKANGFITDEDRYLESITERQDICLNMTKMSNEEIMDNIERLRAEKESLKEEIFNLDKKKESNMEQAYKILVE